MDYIWGVLAGLAFGGLAGIIKYFALWHRTLNAPEDRGIKPSSVYTKMIISNVVNVAVLAVVFIMRKHLPFDFATALLGAAVGLSLGKQACPDEKNNGTRPGGVMTI